MSEPDRPEQHDPPGDRWDAALLAAGFDVDPDVGLDGRAAREVGAAIEDTSLPDPWRDAGTTTAPLTEEQRAYVVATSPALGAELPAQSLTGDDPFGDLSERAMRDADDDVIDFD